MSKTITDLGFEWQCDNCGRLYLVSGSSYETFPRNWSCEQWDRHLCEKCRPDMMPVDKQQECLVAADFLEDHGFATSAELLRQAVARLSFDFLCNRKWDNLAMTDDPGIRFCEGCSKTVKVANTTQEAQECGKAGQCVTIQLRRIRGPGPGGSFVGRYPSA